MERRDLLKDQIEQLGKVLMKMLTNFLGLKSTGDIEESIQQTNEQFQNQLDIDIDKIMTLEKHQLKAYFEEHKLVDTHIEIIAEYLTEIGKVKTDTTESKIYFNKAIDLLDSADEVSQAFSFERMNQRKKIESYL